MNDKSLEYLMDVKDTGLSECCGAPILAYAFCSDCKENI